MRLQSYCFFLTYANKKGKNVKDRLQFVCGELHSAPTSRCAAPDSPFVSFLRLGIGKTLYKQRGNNALITS